MEVRLFKKEDGEKVKELILSILTREYPFDSSAFSDSDLYDLNETYSGPRNRLFVLDDKGQIAGTVAVKEDSKETALIRRIFVGEKYRRKGYGALLMDKALTFCREKGYKNVSLRTTDRMTQAIEFCKKKGFKQVEELDLQGFRIYKFVRQI